MTENTRKNLRRSAFNGLMAMLFCGGLVLGGSEFTGFPWGPLLGAACWVALGLMATSGRVKDDVGL